MIDLQDPALRRRWFPICNRLDVPPRHVFETDLLGQELAVWQSSDGRVNVWENRCPHRGMRLTLGANLGRELRCAYHGHRFAQGSGACTAVPAQPDRVAPRSLCVKTYPVLQLGELIFTRLADDEPAGEPPRPGAEDTVALYAVTVKAAPLAVAGALADYRFRPSHALGTPVAASEACSTSPLDAYSFRALAEDAGGTTEVRLFLQPVAAACTVVHAILLGALAPTLRLPTLKHHALQLTRLRDACERRAAGAAS